MNLFEASGVSAPTDMRPPSGKRLAEQGSFNTFVDSNDGPAWRGFALDALTQYATNHERFAVEDLKAWAYLKGLVEPPAPGAWGPVTSKAIRMGIIKKGYHRKSVAPSQHGKPVMVWQSLIFEEEPQSPAAGRQK